MTAKAASRIIWYSLSVNVCVGATVMESPVCTPIGSKFSIEQTTTQLSIRSRITSISNSFQPTSDSSIKTSLTGERSRPRAAIASNSSRLYAIPPPIPPSVNAGRIMSGNVPISSATRSASTSERATPERGTSSPMRNIASLNNCRSSPFAMACAFAPINFTPCRASAPLRFSSIAALSAVCPPMVGKIASGFSRSMIASITSAVIGSI